MNSKRDSSNGKNYIFISLTCAKTQPEIPGAGGNKVMDG